MRRRIAVAIGWLMGVVGAIALVFAASAGTSLTGSGFSLAIAGLALAVVTDASVGAVLTLRRPGNIVGFLLMLAAILLAVSFLGFLSGAILTEQRGRHDLLAGLAALIGALGIIPSLIVAGPLLALLFPNGRLPGPRWKWPVGAIVAAIAVGSAAVVLRPGPLGGSLADNPFGMSGFAGFEPLWAMGETLAFAAIPFALGLALAAVIVRIRRSGGIERAQLKWFVAAIVVVAAFVTISLVDDATNPTIFDVLAPCSLSLLPVAVGVAILRYRLFEIDRIVSRTIGWATLTGLLVAVYLAAVLVLQSQLSGITQGQTLAVAASTLLAAAVFQPARRRIQRAVDRRFDRARYDGEHTIATYAEDLRDQVDLQAISIHTVAAVDAAVRPRGTSLWLREPGR